MKTVKISLSVFYFVFYEIFVLCKNVSDENICLKFISAFDVSICILFLQIKITFETGIIKLFNFGNFKISKNIL